MNPVARLVVIIAGIAAMAGGIFQMTRGIQEIKGDPELKKLTEESNAAFRGANKDLEEAGKLLQSVLQAIDKDGLTNVRKQKKADVEKVITLYGQALDQIRSAAQKADEAAGRKPGEKWEAYLKATAEAYWGYAATREVSREVARMVLDESVKTTDDMVRKLTEAKKLEEAAEAKMAHAQTLRADAEK